MRILIVDDSKAIQVIVRRALASCGYDDLEIKLASSGTEALDIIRIWHPSIVLSDWHMPEMNGIELLHAINREMLDIKVGFITTENAPNRVREALDAGARFVLHKPFDDHQLHKVILPYLQGSEEEQEALDQADNTASAATASHITLPSAASVAKVINVFTQTPISVEECPNSPFSEGWTPCLLGLFHEEQAQKVCAVAILQINAAAMLGCSFSGQSQQDYQQIVTSHTLPGPVLDSCEKMLRVISATLHHSNTHTDLHLQSVNVVPKAFPKLEVLFRKQDKERVQFRLCSDIYGTGDITLVTS